MKKILLISPSSPKILSDIRKGSNRDDMVSRINPPITQLYLASMLAKHGYEPEIVDTAIDEINWQKIKDGDYLLVGITVIIGEFMRNTRVISAKIKELNPQLPICLGGVMASLFPEEMIKEYNVDYVIQYEGEYSLIELCDYLKFGNNSLNEIRGLVHKQGFNIIRNSPRPGESNIDNYPIPKWELLGEKCNQRQVPYYFRIMGSRGCPFNCTFCYKHAVDEKLRKETLVWRGRSPEHIIEEIESLRKLTNTRVFTFGDDNTFVKKDDAIRLIEYFKKNNLFIEQLFIHQNILSDDLIDAMGGYCTEGAIFHRVRIAKATKTNHKKTA